MTTEAPRKRRRPFGLYAVIVLLVAQNLVIVVQPDNVRIGLARLLPEDVDDSTAVRVLSAGLAVAFLIVIAGLWRLKRWAWVATMIFVGVGLVIGIVQYFRDLPLYWTMLTNVFIVFYLNQRDVQDAFERRRPRELRA
jgi:lysylphosphatidylglycerol synthetase-like protein (DUF2156 family)